MFLPLRLKIDQSTTMNTNLLLIKSVRWSQHYGCDVQNIVIINSDYKNLPICIYNGWYRFIISLIGSIPAIILFYICIDNYFYNSYTFIIYNILYVLQNST